MNNQLKQQVLEQVKSANNVLIAVRSNPTVDELSASIALTLLLNKLGKHATTVFSGVVPSTLEFLQPEKTIETTTDSLRDFIIALDKSKADKLRYKVEDDVVRIFITPYRTSITDQDLQFSQGDFNVDVVIGLGVTKREELDTAITAHGRILHDATVVALTKREITSELGSMNWQEPQASSLCEMVAALAYDLGGESIDGQMATALLTGIIAETDRFKNEKTTPLALSLSSQLMSAGANQQLIAEKLEEPEPAPIPAYTDNASSHDDQPKAAAASNDGELEIDHLDDENRVEKIHIDDHGNLMPESEGEIPEVDSQQPTEETPTDDNDATEPEPQQTYLAPPDVTGTQDKEAENVGQSLFDDMANGPTEEHKADESTEPAKQAKPVMPTMTHGRTIAPPSHDGDARTSDKPFDLKEALKVENQKEAEATVVTPDKVEDEHRPVTQMPPPQSVLPQSESEQATEITPPQPKESLTDLEKAVDSPHIKPEESQGDKSLDQARDTVARVAEDSAFPKPQIALGAQQLGQLRPTQQIEPQPRPQAADPNAAPPVPPPMTAQFYDADGKNTNPFLNPSN
jgi:hypothetical protein